MSLIFCGIVVAILKMETGRNFAMSGINSRHHNLPKDEISLKSDNVEFVQYCGVHFENGDRNYVHCHLRGVLNLYLKDVE
jgi:LEA14-like dessication related protein